MEKKMHNDHNNVINWQAHINYIYLVIYVHVGLTSPAGKCLAGHYCLLGSTEQNPIGQSYGDYCTAGHYCPEGTGSPVPCPIGTYLPSTGQSMLAHCIDCALGKYCDTVGQSNYTGKGYLIICTIIKLFLFACTHCKYYFAFTISGMFNCLRMRLSWFWTVCMDNTWQFLKDFLVEKGRIFANFVDLLSSV